MKSNGSRIRELTSSRGSGETVPQPFSLLNEDLGRRPIGGPFCDCDRVAAPHRRLVAGPQATLSAARTGTGPPVQPILGLFVRPTRDGEARGRVRILAAANDGMSRFGMMQWCRIGRSTQGRQAQGQNEAHNFYSDRATAAHMCCAVSTGTIGSGSRSVTSARPRPTRKLTS